MNKYIITLLLLTVVRAASVQAQATHPVGGTVSDENGKPLPGVRVHSKGADNNAFTNSEGYFHLDAIVGRPLIFTHPRFDELQREAKHDTLEPIRLTSRFLHGPAVGSPTAYEQKDTLWIPSPADQKIDVLYQQTDRESFLGSVSTVNKKALNAAATPDLLAALPGRLTGLNVMQTSGWRAMPLDSLTQAELLGNTPTNSSGAGPTDNSQYNVQLRGHGVSMGQNPIAIVDGVQRELYSIDPKTIQSISILKDPLSTLLLGQNSSRGALIITTNEPQVGATRVDISAETGPQTPLGLPTPLPAYQYAYLLNEALLNDGKPPIYTQADFDAYRNHSDPVGHPDVNWYKTILRSNSPLSRVNLNAAGGSAIARYVVSMSYMNNQGMFVTTSANPYNANVSRQRYLLNSKVDFDVNKYFSLRVQAMGRLEDGTQPGITYNNVLAALLSTPNNAYPVMNKNHTYGGTSAYTQNLLGLVEGSGYALDHLKDVMSNVVLNYKMDKVAKGLWSRASGNVSVESETNMNRSLSTPIFAAVISPGDTSYREFGASSAQQNHYQTGTWARYRYVQLAMGYDRRFGDHSINAELMFDQKRSLVNYDLPSELTNFGGKVAYSFMDRYFIQGSADEGGYNRYAPGHRYGLFYAGGLGWDVTRENFFHQLAPWIDHLKLRATYGRTGNANVDYYGYYIWSEHFGQGAPNYPLGATYNGAEQTLAEGGQPGVSSQFLANINSTWEKADKLDGGIDLAMFHNRIQLTADYYHEKYYDVMQTRGDNVELVGINYPAENLGRDLYTGLEVELTWQDRIGNVSYFISGNAAAQQSKVLYMDEQYEQNPWNVHTGRPVNQMFGYIAEGLFQTAADAAASPSIPGYAQKPGDIKYKDLNGDGSIDQFDLAPIGKPRPLVIYGLSVGVNYKGFEFSALLQGIANRVEYVDQSYYNFGFLNQNNSYSQAYTPALGRWIPENAATASAPRLTAGGNVSNGQGYPFNTVQSSYFIQNGDFFRLRNVMLSYNVPYRWLHRAKFGSVKVFASAQNLLTWAAYHGIDPEVSLPNYPTMRVLNFGLNVKL